MTAPARPTLQLTADDTTASISVIVTNPEPTSGQPAVTSVDVWRREGTGTPVRIAAGLAPGATYTDWTPASRVTYQYRATAHASSNGTSTDSVWNAGPSTGSTGIFAATFTSTF